ncbi:MAG: type VII toxin-antitoxin system HepT family RNase toxin [Anaerolineae bacterium]
MQRLGPLRARSLADFDADPYLRDVAERNLEVAAQCVIDVCQRAISLCGARKPRDYHEAILIAGELGLIPADFARQLAPIAGFRNVLVHQYLTIDWSTVHAALQRLDDLSTFAEYVRAWLRANADA